MVSRGGDDDKVGGRRKRKKKRWADTEVGGKEEMADGIPIPRGEFGVVICDLCGLRTSDTKNGR